MGSMSRFGFFTRRRQVLDAISHRSCPVGVCKVGCGQASIPLVHPQHLFFLDTLFSLGFRLSCSILCPHSTLDLAMSHLPLESCEVTSPPGRASYTAESVQAAMDIENPMPQHAEATAGTGYGSWSIEDTHVSKLYVVLYPGHILTPVQVPIPDSAVTSSTTSPGVGLTYSSSDGLSSETPGPPFNPFLVVPVYDSQFSHPASSSAYGAGGSS